MAAGGLKRRVSILCCVGMGQDHEMLMFLFTVPGVLLITICYVTHGADAFRMIELYKILTLADSLI